MLACLLDLSTSCTWRLHYALSQHCKGMLSCDQHQKLRACIQVTAYWYNGVVVPANWAGKPRPYRDFYLKVRRCCQTRFMTVNAAGCLYRCCVGTSASVMLMRRALRRLQAAQDISLTSPHFAA